MTDDTPKQVLIPPPDIKKIIDVLVVKVAKNGKQFLDMILEHMKGDKKYGFLRSEENPYRPYYLAELGKQEEMVQQEESKGEKAADDGQ